MTEMVKDYQLENQRLKDELAKCKKQIKVLIGVADELENEKLHLQSEGNRHLFDLQNKYHERSKELEELSTEFDDNLKKFETLFENRTVGMLMNDPKGVITIANKTAHDLLGYDYETRELIGTNFVEITHADDLEKSIKGVERILNGEVEGAQFIKRYVGKKGKKLWSRTTGSGVKNEKGEVIGISILIEDQTQYLALENERNRLFEISTDLISIANSKGYFEKINSSFSRVLGYTDEYILSTKRMDFVHPEDIEATKAIVKEIQEKGSASNFQNRYRCADGNYIWLSWSAVLDDVTGDVFAIARDVNNQKLLELKLKEQTLRLQKAQFTIDTSNEVVFWANFNGDLIYSNQKATDVLGYSPEEFKELSVFDLDVDLPKKDWKVHWEVLRISKFISLESRQKAKSGVFIPVELTVSYVEYNGEEFMIGSSRDISERQESQRLIHRKNVELQQFAYIATHDLKVPVANMEGYFSFMKKLVKDDDTRMKEVVLWMGKSIEQAKKTLKDLSVVTEFKGLTEESVEQDLHQLLQGIKDLMHSSIESNNALITSDFSGCSKITFGKIGLKSIFQNLIENALKYRDEERSPVIEIRTELIKDQVCISFKDNGLGIDMDTYEGKLFSLFKRIHDHKEGSGMGLYIIKGLVDDNGGKIKVESKVGVGTTFKVFLPMK